MLKVVLVLRQLLLRLKESEIEVLVKKQKETISLGSQLKVVDGICHANLTTEFYLNPADSTIHLQVLIVQGSQRKLAGNSTLSLGEYEEAVYHETISVLHNSPDKQARIFFNFVYFKDHAVHDPRPLFLTAERYQQEYRHMEHRNTQLLSENRQLEETLTREEMRNEALELIKEERLTGFDQREKLFREELHSRQKNLGDCNKRFEESKLVKQELLELVKAKGFAK